MDSNTITEVVRRPADRPGQDWRDGDAWLARGTRLFSDGPPDLRRLVDITTLGWETLTAIDTCINRSRQCDPSFSTSRRWR